jgi:hypothetical protein
MPSTVSKSPATIGFLSVYEFEGQGLFGGYLILNLAGRPLEFHCTAPVRANRAQEILYGPTLKPYLYGEQIGPALLERAGAKPVVVFTDQEAVLAARDMTTIPIAYVSEEESSVSPTPAADTAWRADPAHLALRAPSRSRLHRFRVGPHALAVDTQRQEDEMQIVQFWQPHAADFDLREPFGRIREALEEARRSSPRS